MIIYSYIARVLEVAQGARRSRCRTGGGLRAGTRRHRSELPGQEVDASSLGRQTSGEEQQVFWFSPQRWRRLHPLSEWMSPHSSLGLQWLSGWEKNRPKSRAKTQTLTQGQEVGRCQQDNMWSSVSEALCEDWGGRLEYCNRYWSPCSPVPLHNSCLTSLKRHIHLFILGIIFSWTDMKINYLLDT